MASGRWGSIRICISRLEEGGEGGTIKKRIGNYKREEGGNLRAG